MLNFVVILSGEAKDAAKSGRFLKLLTKLAKGMYYWKKIYYNIRESVISCWIGRPQPSCFRLLKHSTKLPSIQELFMISCKKIRIWTVFGCKSLDFRKCLIAQNQKRMSWVLGNNRQAGSRFSFVLRGKNENTMCISHKKIGLSSTSAT